MAWNNKVSDQGLRRMFERWALYSTGSGRNVGYWDPIVEEWVERASMQKMRAIHLVTGFPQFRYIPVSVSNAEELRTLAEQVRRDADELGKSNKGRLLWDPSPDQWFAEAAGSITDCARYEAELKAARDAYRAALLDCAEILDRGGSAETADECQEQELRRYRATLTRLKESYPECAV